MNPKKGDHLLDVASGTGDVAKAFLKRTEFSGKLTCVEPNKLMLELGKKKLKNLGKIEWHCSPAEKLPFKNDTFDLYSVSFGLRNFSNINLSLKEARIEFEKEYLLSQIKRFNGNIIKISEFTGMERTALYRKFKSLNISLSNK